MTFVGTGPAAPIAVEVLRGGIVESVHRADIAVVSRGGELIAWAGDPNTAAFARSSLKPILAQGMVELGFTPASKVHAALAASSHSGEPMHIAEVQAALAAVGLDESALANTPDWPLDEQAKVDWIASGGAKTSIHANCSGKHAAMLATCLANGWPTRGYLDPSHPLPRALSDYVASVTGANPAHQAVDGCGALVWAIPLVSLARAFSALAQAPAGSAGSVIANAMRAAPEYVAGTRRETTALMRSFPGLIAKDGVEGMYAAALPDGRGLALKISDGGVRARPAAIAGALAALGLDEKALASIENWEQVLGGGVPVGRIRSVVKLERRD
jgi:L-asparaginase II